MVPATPIRREGHIVITGGAGFLGTNIADALARRGDDVLVLDNLSRRHVRENLTWLMKQHPAHIRPAIGDVRDHAILVRSVQGARAVVHLAAQVAVTTSVEDPVEDFDINARGTLQVLEAVRRHAPDAMVLFASTNKVYGKLVGFDRLERTGKRYVPRDVTMKMGFDERTPLSLYSPYGCSKGAADQYVVDYARIYGLKTVVFRMSCLYGPHQYGTEDQGWVAHFLLSALRRLPISIYGDGYQVRDVLYVDDAVAAYLLALDNIDALSGNAFNLGGGTANTLSLRELLDQIARLQGASPEVSYHSWRPGDQPWYVSNTRAFSDVSGWQARTGISQGLESLHAWLAGFVAPERTAFEREAVA
ncbi:MAG TPA: NAD-dependent epimerase/dehydratase family protein [Rhizomicrobium sp.]|jgi:CDP-paratose 2-epimerase|nr:NAD-dependent epimerase/dehydratase family protein [Rhizomicrobium sp.]